MNGDVDNIRIEFYVYLQYSFFFNMNGLRTNNIG